MSKPIQTVQGSGVPLPLDNVDTDQIIPARFLKGTSREGLGENLFADLRYEKDGAPNLDFVLNDPRYAHGKILVAGHNFGCGSSREHAPWALKDYGFLAVIAISFADIFRNNAMKNGIIPVELEEPAVRTILETLKSNPQAKLQIDLEAQQLSLPDGRTHSFDIHPFWKKCLMEGLDQIQYTLSHEAKIKAFEASRQAS